MHSASPLNKKQLSSAQSLALMRDQVAMAGIVSLSEHIPKFIPLDARPTPATDYLYDAIIITSLTHADAARRGLQDFFAFLIAEVLNPRNLPLVTEVVSRKPSSSEGKVLRKMRAEFSKNRPNFTSLQESLQQWDSSIVGVGDDTFMCYQSRRHVARLGDCIVRAGVSKTVRTLFALENGDYDWWHLLGTSISYFAHGYMASEWGQLPIVPNRYIDLLSDEAADEASQEIEVAQVSYMAMRWRYEESLFMALALCIGNRCGRLPDKKPESSYPKPTLLY